MATGSRPHPTRLSSRCWRSQRHSGIRADAWPWRCRLEREMRHPASERGGLDLVGVRLDADIGEHAEIRAPERFDGSEPGVAVQEDQVAAAGVDVGVLLGLADALVPVPPRELTLL